MKNNTPFFTIIIPIYNAERFLRKAIDSLLNQTFKDFQLLLIDDCSTDNSFNICRSLSKKDYRIEVYQTKENSGAAAARNYGLERAQGVYISFCDSDDYVDSDMLEKAYSYLKTEEIDCLKYGCTEEYYDPVNGTGYHKFIVLGDELINIKNDIASKCLEMELKPLFGYIWNGFYKRDYITKYKIKFNCSYRVNEDFDFNIQYFKYVTTLQCMNYCGYHYRKEIGSNSLSTQRKDDYYELHMMKIRKFLDFFSGYEHMNFKDKKKLFWLYTRFIYSTLQRVDKSKKEILDTIYYIKKDALYALFEQVDFNDSPYKQRVMVNFLRLRSPVLLLSLIRIIGWIKSKFPFFFARIKG